MNVSPTLPDYDTMSRRVRVRALAANAVPLVGVVAFGWSAGTVLAVYWIETAVAAAFGVARALVAQRPPRATGGFLQFAADWRDKRGGITVGVLPPVYPRNVPVVAATVVAVVVFWPLAGLLIATSVTDQIGVGLAAAVAGLVVGHGVETVRYATRAAYTTTSAHDTLPRGRLFGLACLVVAGVVVVRAAPGVASTALVGVVAAGKFGVELTLPNRGVDDSEAASPPRLPADEPVAVMRTDRRAVLVRTAALTPLYALLPPYVVVTAVGVLLWLTVGWVVGAGTLLAAVAVTALARVVYADVAVGHVEYRVYPDRVVAYDRLLDTPQWSFSRRAITDASVETTPGDWLRPGEGRPVRLSTADEERYLAAVAAPERLVAAVR